MFWKIEACGDTVYVDAPSEESAREYLEVKMGKIPASLLTVTKINKLPKDEECL